MGGQISKMMGKIFGSKEMRLLMLGLDAAGKTSTFRRQTPPAMVALEKTCSTLTPTVTHFTTLLLLFSRLHLLLPPQNLSGEQSTDMAKPVLSPPNSNPLQAQAEPGRHHHPHRRVQRRNGQLQERQI